MRILRTSAMTLALISVAAVAPASAQHEGRKQMEAGTMRIRLTVDGKVLTATLLDNATARDFASLLPLELTMEDHASTEKIAHPPRKLSTEGSPAGADPEVGDIAYYAPWGNLAIYYRDFGYSPGLVKLGRIEGDVRALAVRASLKVRIEPAGN